MLYSFFISQWNQESKGDWTVQIRLDLADFQIPCSFDYIKGKTKNEFKSLVKRRAREYALNYLNIKKAKHSKLKNLNYKSQKIQSNLTSNKYTLAQKKTIFQYKTRMAKFGENFRGGKEHIMCPLCGLHLDNQAMSYMCEEIKSVIKVVGDINSIYDDNIDVQTVKTICSISEFRREFLDK